MNSVNANWMSESFQPVAFCRGLTNSVQEYCRLAIMIIATNEAPSWNQRLFNRIAPPDLQTQTGPVVERNLRSAISGRRFHRFLNPQLAINNQQSAMST